MTDEVTKGMMVDEQVDWGASWVINEVDNVVQDQEQLVIIVPTEMVLE